MPDTDTWQPEGHAMLTTTQTAALIKLAERTDGSWMGVGAGFPVHLPTALSLVHLGLVEMDEPVRSMTYGLSASGNGYRARHNIEHAARLTPAGRAKVAELS